MRTMKDEGGTESTLTRKELQAREGAAAMAEYQAARRALVDNTARLREARLAREAAEMQAKAAPAPAKKVRIVATPTPAAPAKKVRVVAAPAKKVRVAGRRK
jgi:hypothetical protein